MGCCGCGRTRAERQVLLPDPPLTEDRGTSEQWDVHRPAEEVVPCCNKTRDTHPGRSCRRTILSMALLAIACSTSGPMRAQTTAAANPVAQRRRARSESIMDDRVKVLAKNLDLTDAQQAAVKSILEQRQQETLRLRLDPSLSGEARFDRFRTLQDRTVERIRAVLNDEQKKKYDPLILRKVQPAPHQRTVQDWLNGVPPR